MRQLDYYERKLRTCSKSQRHKWLHRLRKAAAFQHRDATGTIDIQRLRNLTTGRLHTSLDDWQRDLGFVVGDDGIMTHMLPRVAAAITPWLRAWVTDPRFWNGKYDATHVGKYPFRRMTERESDEALERYKKMPNPLFTTTPRPSSC